jgi:hypothetical protein
MAMAIPESDMMLAVMPTMRNGMKATSTTTGMVIMGISALGMSERNSRMTRATVTITSSRVHFRLSMARRMRSERS